MLPLVYQFNLGKYTLQSRQMEAGLLLLLL